MVLVDHPNVLKSHCSFVSDHNLWVVMPYMAGGSCLHILKAAHPDGFEEVVIATILREVLKGLDYLHQHGHIHRDVKVSGLALSMCHMKKILVKYLMLFQSKFKYKQSYIFFLIFIEFYLHYIWF